MKCCFLLFFKSLWPLNDLQVFPWTKRVFWRDKETSSTSFLKKFFQLEKAPIKCQTGLTCWGIPGRRTHQKKSTRFFYFIWKMEKRFRKKTKSFNCCFKSTDFRSNVFSVSSFWPIFYLKCFFSTQIGIRIFEIIQIEKKRIKNSFLGSEKA